ncbi:porin [Erwinia sp. AnSW2-5]|uniref:porin n=1 Tax=Erwinia sp. AnSW2-5 TaxID=3367692 RepID=UPI003859AAA0
MQKTGKALAVVMLVVVSSSASATITVLEKNTLTDPWLAPLSLGVSGSVRPEFIWHRGEDNHAGHDGGTRFRFSADYLLRPGTSIIGFYSLGVDTAHALGLKHHYDHDRSWDRQRKLFGGIKDDRYGTLTFGHQYSVYYDTIGGKSDVWGNDGNASANWIGVGGDYDGGERPRNSLKYKNTFGDLTLYASYLLPQDELVLDNSQYYRRKRGGGIGFDYRLAKDLTMSASWNQTNATVRGAGATQRHYRQAFSGAAMTWTPGNWYLVSTATMYRHYVPAVPPQSTDDYFARHGYGLEAFAGYTFPINKPYLHSVQPYFAVDTLRLQGNEHYHANHSYLGIYTQLAYGFSVYLEQTFTATTANDPNVTSLSIYYDF